MYQLDNLALFAIEKDQYPHITRWANESLFQSINVKKHKIGIKTVEILLSQLPPSTQLLAITMNKELIGFCEIYSIDASNRTCSMNVHLDNMSQNFLMYGYKILTMICNYIYTIIGMNKISADILLENNVSLSVFKQRGFKIEVHKRSHILSYGSYKTVAELSLLRSEIKL